MSIRAQLEASQLNDAIGRKVRCREGDGLLLSVRWSELSRTFMARICLGDGSKIISNYRFVEVLPDQPTSFDGVAELAREIL